MSSMYVPVAVPGGADMVSVALPVPWKITAPAGFHDARALLGKPLTDKLMSWPKPFRPVVLTV
jgi:hypothetical protein